MNADQVAIPPPEPYEFPDFYGRYIRNAGSMSDAPRQLEDQRDRLAVRLGRLSEEQGLYRYAPGKWSVKELVGHMCDSERVFAYRLMRIGRGDETPLPGFDENAYAPAGEFDRRPLADLVDEWRAVRNATVPLVQGMPAGAWSRRGVTNGNPITARALLYVILGHAEHHLNVLAEKYGVS